tara:strand:+ start:3288 stop:3575 length:288 start_codon:yes stop_codon:yes gene_type:complete
MISRYSYVSVFEGKSISNSECVQIVQEGIRTGRISIDTSVLAGNQRLDVLSGQIYGTSEFWWVIAAASGIGWGMQVPAGTLLRIPTDINQVLVLL